MLTLIPVSLAQANEFVRQHHRHHKPVAGHKFSIGCAENGRLCAVAIVGRPVSRYLDDGFTLEVNRLCSDGTKNACSILYAAAARAARAMGYHKIVTYTLDTENGASLRAAGWTNAGLAGGKAWTGSRRPTQPLYPAQMKYRYEKRLNGGWAYQYCFLWGRYEQRGNAGRAASTWHPRRFDFVCRYRRRAAAHLLLH